MKLPRFYFGRADTSKARVGIMLIYRTGDWLYLDINLWWWFIQINLYYLGS